MEYYMPDIPSSDFLSIFVVSALIILFGMAYAGFFTLVKLKLLKRGFMIAAYGSWLVLVSLMFYLGELLRVEPYTQKVLIGAMVGYLIFPHIVYFLLERVHDRFEHEPNN
jgi:small basic protein